MDGRRRGEREVNRWHTGREEARERDSGSSSPAAILLFALIGATVTTAAVGQLRRTFGWFYTQLSRSQPYVYWEDMPRGPNRCGDAWRYYRRTRETNEDQRKRVERIMHMQDMFKKERSKCRDYRTRNGHNPTYNQHSRREDWYEDAETFYANQRANFRSRPREAMQYSMSHHYSVLGLNRSRAEPFSDAEIKNAFRRKAMEYHPDQNQNNKAVAEEKFKEVMDSYEAIKLERQNGSC
ncbi:dnaJ homolog subfamily C member 7-like isoform X1 [Hordeum vulgare subsp. vulgare]|uniref:Predicted protein n=1 Tax=Hordeum vulgare subsp. vulgare TaxID=112509 RepID=F2D5S2_HORVV|nr:dnaJ homolog subfamily C member 7-like isoform X1 [Hordeum vulgare subsp. vulgare]KAI5012573.1 hypothetical protein ZWY2020_024839 [Hordeum vulgare]BAJ90443.1 predicted protein [Hordeum vulgare subsp. vulgare]